VSLTLAEARARAALISDVSYDIHLDLTDRDSFACETTVRFACSAPGATTFLELARAGDVTVAGAPAAYDGHRIELRDLAATNEVEVAARIPYVSDGDGMHTFTDPADGETYVSAYVGMDVAQRVFPCFDQNDLKPRVTLTVTAPEGWTVLANGRCEDVSGTPDRPGVATWSFATTPPIPVPMFVVCAGPWHSVTWEHTGPDGRTLPFGWHARRSLADALDRDAAELREITERCFDHYGQIFTEPYAYDSYDQAMVPGQNWGALETPGCVTYRDELLPIGEPTEGERRRRAVIIAHEMAHMWFGNLVTMTWWEDTWLQESFADHMGFRVAEAAAGVEGAFVDFTIGRKPGAYAADERRSTHPVAALAEEVPDVDAAAGNFDSISYAKGNASLQQLVTWLGYEEFLAGVNAYLARHRLGNATLDDFVDALDSASGRDVRGWVSDWLRTTGFDTLRVERTERGAELVREGSRPHRVRVGAYDDTLAPLGDELVDLGDRPVPVRDAPVLVPNSGGETYARIRFDEASWEVLARDLASLPDDSARAIVWSAAFDLVRVGEMAAEDFLGLVTRHLPREGRVAILEAVIAWSLGNLLPRHVPAGGATAALGQLAAACESGLASDPTPEAARALTRGLAATTPDAELLERWLLDRETHSGMAVDPVLRWSAIRRLAALGALDATAIRDERESDGTVVGALGAARALAAIPEAGAKADAWARMFEDPEVSNRVLTWTAEGFWDPEQLDLVRPYVPSYAEAAPRVAEARGQAFSQLVGAAAFPAVPLDEAELRLIESALEAGVPTALSRPWQDALDDRRLAAGVARPGRRTST
jgi:aminopeptidase N